MADRTFLRTAIVLTAAAALAACASSPTEPMARSVEVPKTEKAVEVANLEIVYFDFDRADIRGDARAILKANAAAVQRSGGWRKIVVEGHCDERGGEEYNMGLGERRADAVKRYLVQAGVPSSKISTVSYGEARPRTRGKGESSWSSNRRVEFTLVN